MKIVKGTLTTSSCERYSSVFLIIAIVGVLIFKHFMLYLPPGPYIYGDELIYKENAESIFYGKYFFSSHYPPLYSLVISIAFFFNNWYEGIQIINGILSSLLIIPIWMISRMFVSIYIQNLTLPIKPFTIRILIKIIKYFLKSAGIINII